MYVVQLLFIEFVADPDIPRVISMDNVADVTHFEALNEMQSSFQTIEKNAYCAESWPVCESHSKESGIGVHVV